MCAPSCLCCHLLAERATFSSSDRWRRTLLLRFCLKFRREWVQNLHLWSCRSANPSNSRWLSRSVSWRRSGKPRAVLKPLVFFLSTFLVAALWFSRLQTSRRRCRELLEGRFAFWTICGGFPQASSFLTTLLHKRCLKFTLGGARRSTLVWK